MFSLKNTLLPCTLAMVLACTWVKPVEHADEVALVNQEHVVNCTKLGQTTSSVKDKLGLIKRKENKVSEELLTLAKNSAVEMGGDTVMVVSEAVDGEQSFAVFDCQ